MAKNTLPVSVKAYRTLRERIDLIVTDEHNRTLMTEALDRYLDGDRTTFADALDEKHRLAFEFLRFDIDQALIRSERARKRRRNRVTADISADTADAATTHQSPQSAAQPTHDGKPATPMHSAPEIPIINCCAPLAPAIPRQSRRERRAAARHAAAAIRKGRRK